MQSTGPGTPSKRREPDLSHSLAIINAVAYTINTVVVGASAVGLFGLTQKGVTDAFPTLVTPALLTFGIWNFIYMGEALWCGWALLKRLDNQPTPNSVKAMGPWFALANVLQAAWSIPWAQKAMSLSTTLNWAATFSLVAASLGLRRARRNAATAKPHPVEVWGAHLTVPLHAGWVLAATLVNANMSLVAAGAPVASQLRAAIATALGLGAAGFYGGVQNRDVGFVAGIAWALFGIAAKQSIRASRLSADTAGQLQLAVGAIGGVLTLLLARMVKQSGGVQKAIMNGNN